MQPPRVVYLWEAALFFKGRNLLRVMSGREKDTVAETNNAVSACG